MTAPMSVRIAGTNFVHKVLLHRHQLEILTGCLRDSVLSRIFWAIVSTSAWACTIEAPGLSRPIARHCTSLRLATS